MINKGKKLDERLSKTSEGTFSWMKIDLSL